MDPTDVGTPLEIIAGLILLGTIGLFMLYANRKTEEDRSAQTATQDTPGHPAPAAATEQWGFQTEGIPSLPTDFEPRPGI